MFLKFRPLIYSLLFYVGLELIVLFHHWAHIVGFFLFLLAFYEGKKVGKKWHFSILPAIFTVSTVSLLYLVRLNYEQQIFIALAAVIYYLALFGAYRLGNYKGDQTALAMKTTAAAATIFFTYTGFYGIYLNFLVPLYVLMLAYLVVTLLVSYHHFSSLYLGSQNDANGNQTNASTKINKKTRWIYSFALGLAMAEIIWTMNYWPFGYLTTGTIAFILYYILWDMSVGYFQNMLSKKRVVANLALFSVLVTLILLCSKWIPVI